MSEPHIGKGSKGMNRIQIRGVSINMVRDWTLGDQLGEGNLGKAVECTKVPWHKQTQALSKPKARKVSLWLCPFTLSAHWLPI